MANMPSFAAAAAIARECDLQDRVGVHLNLTEGLPLTEPIRRSRRFCDGDGQMSHRTGTIWLLTPDQARAVAAELAAQIEAVLAEGITPSHLDSHHHIHTHWPICAIVMRLASYYRIPAIRPARNCVPGLLPKRLYKTALNKRLARAGFARVDRFGAAREAEHCKGSFQALEIMTHPDLDAQGRLIDRTTGAGPLEDVARDWRAMTGLISYSELCERR